MRMSVDRNDLLDLRGSWRHIDHSNGRIQSLWRASLSAVPGIRMTYSKLQNPVPLNELMDAATTRAYERELEENRKLKARIANLEHRLGEYECPEHAEPDYECEACLKHLRDAGALEREKAGPWD